MRYNLNARTDCQFIVQFISSSVSELVAAFQNRDLFAQISSQLCKFLVCICIYRRVFGCFFVRFVFACNFCILSCMCFFFLFS